ncbi:hypothetical protein GCM10009525_47220 [Streptosporangium amethystogenes subsp. fukuiense]
MAATGNTRTGAGHKGADGEVTDDDVDGVGAQPGAEVAVPVDAAQQSSGGLPRLGEYGDPVGPDGDGVGQRVAAARDGDRLVPAVLVGFVRRGVPLRSGGSRSRLSPDRCLRLLQRRRQYLHGLL